ATDAQRSRRARSEWSRTEGPTRRCDVPPGGSGRVEHRPNPIENQAHRREDAMLGSATPAAGRLRARSSLAAHPTRAQHGPMRAPRVLVVSGSVRPDGQAAAVVEHVLAVTRRAGAELRVHDP